MASPLNDCEAWPHEYSRNSQYGSLPTIVLSFAGVGRLAGMNRQLAIELLSAHKAVLATRFGVLDLALFGSTARNTAGADSDVDLLVEFDGPATSDKYFGVQFYLEDLLGQRVDLVTQKALRPEFRPFIESEAVHV